MVSCSSSLPTRKESGFPSTTIGLVTCNVDIVFNRVLSTQPPHAKDPGPHLAGSRIPKQRKSRSSMYKTLMRSPKPPKLGANASRLSKLSKLPKLPRLFRLSMVLGWARNVHTAMVCKESRYRKKGGTWHTLRA